MTNNLIDWWVVDLFNKLVAGLLGRLVVGLFGRANKPVLTGNVKNRLFENFGLFFMGKL